MTHLRKNSLKLWNSVSRFSGHRLILSGALGMSLVVLLTCEAFSESEATSAFSCRAGVASDSVLPASHPRNRCALKAKELNWRSWLAGKSGSGQFHYFDLFELLHRKQSVNNTNTDKIAPER